MSVSVNPEVLRQLSIGTDTPKIGVHKTTVMVENVSEERAIYLYIHLCNISVYSLVCRQLRPFFQRKLL